MSLVMKVRPEEFVKITLEDGRIICIKIEQISMTSTKMLIEAEKDIRIERVRLFSDNKFMEPE